MCVYGFLSKSKAKLSWYHSSSPISHTITKNKFVLFYLICGYITRVYNKKPIGLWLWHRNNRPMEATYRSWELYYNLKNFNPKYRFYELHTSYLVQYADCSNNQNYATLEKIDPLSLQSQSVMSLQLQSCYILSIGRHIAQLDSLWPFLEGHNHYKLLCSLKVVSERSNWV